MRVVRIRELKNRLSEYIRIVRGGEDVLVTDRGRVVAQIGEPRATRPDLPLPELRAFVAEGRARIGAPKDPSAYPALDPLLPPGEARRLLDEERAER